MVRSRITAIFWGRRREIDELQNSVEMLEKDLEEKQAELDGYREKRNHFRDEVARLGELLQEQYLRDNTVRMNLQSMSAKKQEIADSYESLKRENAELEKQVAEISENSDSIRLELETSAAQEKALEDAITGNQEILDEKKKLESERSKSLEQAHLETANLTSKRGFLEENLSRLKEETDDLQSQMESLQGSLENGRADMEKKVRDIEEIRQTIAEAEKEAVEDEAKMQEYLQRRDEMNRSHKSFFDKRDELSARMNLLDKECYRLTSQKEKLEENQENQVNYMWEEYEMTYGQALGQAPGELLERSEIKKALGVVRDEIKKLGNVNVNAIEEYKELSERHTFLSTQHGDLVQAEQTLLGIIDELDTGMRNQFEEKFSQIRVEFDKAFKELFGGGKGTLELDEDADILEAGIRIISQPPGKKLQNMMQLSGGEKALTAIALLFAIQNLKPSPFCLLDEIEAALDDSNVTRYAKYLHKLTKIHNLLLLHIEEVP